MDMEMTERQLIQEILNTVDVIYKFVNTDDDKKEYEIVINRQDGDHRPLEEVNKEIKHYFTDANFSYDEKLNDGDDDIHVDVKR
ncbi:MAG: hypothetical protein ABF753_07720 [Lentilactobacillus hilgardii]|nr:hypothetical protein HMPREF0497_0797 [Lentilactobacillus buchneri ATCC 11577]KRK56702.1 hypothetical protein FD42_GL000242 [Lentilactobacillus hilgardii DSM 20176 = ATCC 8290]